MDKLFAIVQPVAMPADSVVTARARAARWRSAMCAMLVLFTASAAGSWASAANRAGALVFSQTSYSVQQGAGTVTVTVDRTGGSKGAVSVNYATANGTAAAGTDYTAKSGTLSWNAGGSAPKSFKVRISSATPFSGNRSFSIALSGAAGGATLGTPHTATVVIAGSGTSGSAGSISLSAASYSVAQSGGAVVIDLQRTGGSSGAVTVNYATSNGTAVAGTDYTAASGTASWGNGDVSTKSFSVAVSDATPFTGTKTFTVGLSGASNGASLMAPSSATVSITGGGAATGSVSLSSATYSVQQSAGAAQVTVARTDGSSGAASVNYATANGSAVAGTDYTASSGTLNWASGDTSTKTFSVPLSDKTPFTGTKSFGVNLSDAVDSSLGNPASGTVAITGSGSQSANCAQNGNSYTTSNDYGYVVYGNYVVTNNNWGGTPGQKLWANSADCWGVTTTATKDGGSPESYPAVTRGWSDNGSVMQQLSDAGTNDWTTKSGMGISVTALTQATAHWAFSAPTTGTRWMGLMDIYFHKTNSPAYTQFPPYTDLMVDQALQDEVIGGGTTFYAATAQQDNATTVTLGGVQFVIYIDDASEDSFHNGGHTIHLFELPTAFTSNNADPAWGSMNSRIDIKAIIDYLRQSNPVDDNGKPLKTASGATVTSPLITDDLYLNAVNAGWEVDTGTPFTNTTFCLAMQNEPACP
ncbi:MAG TPA: Calx-beta domain-containing protein [Steroidobacteraceae bacterium]|nr:Calx-beta domain-containing protein [Steroidobacteraceae bacterium]